MEQDLDFGSLNFDRGLGDLRQAEKNFRSASPGFEPELRAYIKALQTLNAEMLAGLDSFLGQVRGTRLPEERTCRGAKGRPRSAPIPDTRGARRMVVASASQR
jgi:hypothetical protein